MRVLDLFSGIGGFSLGLESLGMETVAFCEMDVFCQKVLKKHWPNVPIHSDIKELDGHEYRGAVELICGGFPCQPFSVAGEQRGAEDDRALWPEMLRVICEVQPTWVIGENVSGIINMELDNVLSDLEAEGYAAQTFVIPACSVDAKHRRDRVWIIAHADSESGSDVSRHESELVADSNGEYSRSSRSSEMEKGSTVAVSTTGEQLPPMADPSGQSRWSGRVHRESGDQGWGTSEARGEGIQSKNRQSQSNNFTTSGKNVANTDSFLSNEGSAIAGGCGKGNGTQQVARSNYGDQSEQPAVTVWATEPNVGRVADGVPDRTHRLKALGNAVVPPLVAEIGRIVMYHQENGLDPR